MQDEDGQVEHKLSTRLTPKVMEQVEPIVTSNSSRHSATCLLMPSTRLFVSGFVPKPAHRSRRESQ
eukprot:6407685-Karenia_brevis.AAC.1